MANLKSLQLAIELATRRRDQADQVVMQVRRVAQLAQGQLDQLQSYAFEVQTRWATANAATFNAELMRHQQQFEHRLQQAIELQTATMDTHRQQLEVVQQERLQAEIRRAALEQLLNQKQAEQMAQQARREQKQMDELGMQRHVRRSRADRPGDRASGE